VNRVLHTPVPAGLQRCLVSAFFILRLYTLRAAVATRRSGTVQCAKTEELPAMPP
jgi:hypothetical protein